MFSIVTKQLKRALSAVTSVLAIAGSAAAVLDPKLRAFLVEGEQLDGLKPIQLALVRWIQDDNQRLEEHEAAQRAALRQLKQLRLHRDELQKKLYSQLLRIGKAFEDAFGVGKAAIYLGLEPGLRDAQPMVFRRQAQETIGILQDPGLATPEPIVTGIWESPASYAEQLQETFKPFRTSLDEIEAQKREVEKAQKAKTDLLAELGDRLTWSIRLFEAIYRLADLGFHADRLRRSTAARASSEEPEGEPETGAEGETQPEPAEDPPPTEGETGPSPPAVS